MEKDLEAEKERDRHRATKFLEPKFNFSEPPPKVPSLPFLIYSAVHLDLCISLRFFPAFRAVSLCASAALKTEPWSIWEYPRHRSAHSGIVHVHYISLFFFRLLCLALPFRLQLNEALCASSPDLASPCDYQSPVDSTNILTVPSMPVRRLSLGVSLPSS